MADQAAQSAKSPPIRAEIAGNRLELIESGLERFNLLLELIAGASKSIRMLMYMFNPDKDGDVVRDALTEAASRGVKVKLLIDGFGSAASPDFFTRLGQAGGEHCVFNPSWGRRYLLRNHQKLIVIDDETVLIGGANIDATISRTAAPSTGATCGSGSTGPRPRSPAAISMPCSAGRSGRGRSCAH